MKILSFEAAECLEQLVTSGVQLRTVGDDLQARANGGLDDETRERIRENKDGLLQLLRLKEHRWAQVGKWNFSIGRVPSQVEPGMVDLWVQGERLDKEGYTFWFAGREAVGKVS